MTIRDALVQEFDVELPYTRRSLDRVPIDKFEWKPHQKSMTLGWLATFLALVPIWGVMTIEMDEFDPTAASGGQRPGQSVVHSGALARPARIHPQSHRAPSRAAQRVAARLQEISVPAIENDSADEKGGVFRD